MNDECGCREAADGIENTVVDDAGRVSEEEHVDRSLGHDDGDGNRYDREPDLSPSDWAKSNAGRNGDDGDTTEAGSKDLRNDEDACLCRADNNDG